MKKSLPTVCSVLVENQKEILDKIYIPENLKRLITVKIKKDGIYFDIKRKKK